MRSQERLEDLCAASGRGSVRASERGTAGPGRQSPGFRLETPGPLSELTPERGPLRGGGTPAILHPYHTGHPQPQTALFISTGPVGKNSRPLLLSLLDFPPEVPIFRVSGMVGLSKEGMDGLGH